MRVPLHDHFHVSVTSCQRAEVKRVLHCDATTSADMNALLSKKLPAAGIYAFQQIQIYPNTFHISSGSGASKCIALPVIGCVKESFQEWRA